MTKSVNNPYDMNVSTVKIGGQANRPQGTAINQGTGKSFNDVLSKIQNKEIKFSKHAMDRLASRNIQLSEADMKKIEGAVDKAESKGIKEALILMDDKILVMSIRNRTVITASDEASLKDSVFTNIDGAVIL